jgi:hypothetical protein
MSPAFAKRIILIAGLVLTSGCAKTWVHPTKTESQFHADSLQCQQMALRMHPDVKSERMPVKNLPPDSYQTNCTDYGTTIDCNTQAIGGGPDPYAMGYNAGAQMGEGLAQAFNGIAQQRTFDKCLLSKGYKEQ